MHFSLKHFTALTAIWALSGCPSDKGETSESGETETGEPATAGETETGEPATAGETETGEPATAGETEEPATAGESETGDPSPAECEQPDPAANAAFELVFKDWEAGNFAEFDVQCVVDGVTVADAAVTTAITCEVEGAPEPASLRFAVAPEGAVAWDAGAAVRLLVDKNFDFASRRIVQLRAAADDAILVVAVSGGIDNNSGYPEAFLPLVYDFSSVCPVSDDTGGDGTPAQIDLSDPGKAELHLISQHRGSLAIDAEHAYAVDAGEVVIGESNHYPVSQEVLLRRVRLGE
ncbi:hypothetical protein [Nannocystis bainbridge]|uniref:Lipoprotein n=1 Tax=Nannocystis bainbridge TaxID=2995303 RepID=A0ABT5DRR7_9BACT|nr:hypothetical protein [Nannocystis bainbridge]MDC0716347.1 hypothetical protein [Nannocystis bainbridge]